MAYRPRPAQRPLPAVPVAGGYTVWRVSYEAAEPTVELAEAVALVMLAPHLSHTVWMAPMEHFRGLVREQKQYSYNASPERSRRARAEGRRPFIYKGPYFLLRVAPLLRFGRLVKTV